MTQRTHEHTLLSDEPTFTRCECSGSHRVSRQVVIGGAVIIIGAVVGATVAPAVARGVVGLIGFGANGVVEGRYSILASQFRRI